MTPFQIRVLMHFDSQIKINVNFKSNTPKSNLKNFSDKYFEAVGCSCSLESPCFVKSNSSHD